MPKEEISLYTNYVYDYIAQVGINCNLDEFMSMCNEELSVCDKKTNLYKILDALKNMDTDSARNILMTITGVGPKVADCTLLFGLYRIDAFPKDVWIKRAMETLFPDGLPQCAKECPGIVQQYIFYYSRSGNLNI